MTKQSKKAKPIKQRSLSVCDEYVKRHHLGLMLCAIPWPAPWRALFIAFWSYVLFLIAAAFSNFTIVVGSFLHIWQVTFSITIFLATWLGYSILASIKPWLTSAKRSLRISDEDFQDLSQSVSESLGSKWSYLFSLLFIVAGTVVGFRIAFSLPSPLFPFSGFSLVFIYSVLIQFCVVMLMILGAGCWVIIFVFANGANKLSQLSTTDHEIVDDTSVGPLSRIALRNCIFMLVTIASAMPGVAYVGFSFGNRQVILIVTVFGMILPTLGIALSFFAPNYYLSQILSKARYARVTRIKEQIRICDGELERRLSELAAGPTLAPDDGYIRLSNLSRHLHQRLKEARAESTWPVHASSLFRLGGSALLPAIAFFLERAVRSWFP